MFFWKRSERSAVQRREHERVAYTEMCLIQTDTGSYRAKALNISKGGLSVRLRGLGNLTPQTEISITLQNFPAIKGVVRWINGRTLGVQFTTSVERHREIKALIARLQAGKPARL